MPDGVTDSDAIDATTGSGNDPTSWRAALPAELRDTVALARFDDVAALAREHLHLQSAIGRKGLMPPGADAAPEERDAFFSALGRPATPDDYDLSDFDLPDGMPWNGDLQAAMLTEMHAAGLTNMQTKALIAAYAGMQGDAWQQAVDAQGAASTRAAAALEAEWGERFDARLDLANRAFRAAFGDDVGSIAGLQLADGGQVGDHPAFVRAFATLGERMAEPELVGGKSAAMTPSGEVARATLRQLENDPDFRAALLDRAHPDHRAAIAKRSALTGAAYSRDDSAD